MSVNSQPSGLPDHPQNPSSFASNSPAFAESASWSQQYPPPHSAQAPQQLAAPTATTSTWYDSYRIPHQVPQNSAVAAASSLQKLSVAPYTPGSSLAPTYSIESPVVRNPSHLSSHSNLSSITAATSLDQSNDYNDDSKTGSKRIRIACDSCRKKKTKCDGQSPCSNCRASNKQSFCNYTDRPIKRKRSAKSSGVKKPESRSASDLSGRTAENLDYRLSKLENVLHSLTQKLDVFNNLPMLQQKDPNRPKQSRNVKRKYPGLDNQNNSAQGTGRGSDDEEMSDESESSEGSESSDQSDNNSTTSSQGEKSNDPETKPDLLNSADAPNSVNNTVASHMLTQTKKYFARNEVADIECPASKALKTKEIYFGAQSLMSVFSEPSLDRLEKEIGPSEDSITLPVRNMPLIFIGKCKSFLLKWIDPPVIDHKKRRELFTRPFPSDHRLVYDLIDYCYDEDSMLGMLFSKSAIRDIFADYYRNFELVPSKRRKFKLSDFLVMTSSLLSSISSKIDMDLHAANRSVSASVSNTPASVPGSAGPHSSASPATPDSLQRIPNADLIKLKNSLFDNAIFYYHRISVISDGLETVKAILHLMVYIESNWFTSHVNYTLAAVAIRFSQEIGLHRSETYDGLERSKLMERLRVFWLITFFDTEICFRTGKPPILNSADVTVKDDEFIRSYCRLKYFSQESVSSQPGGECTALEYLSKISVLDHDFFRIYHSMMTKIRTRSYEELFVALSEESDFRLLSVKLDHLNKDMNDLAGALPEEDKPRFFNDPKFHFIEKSDMTQRDAILGMHFTYLVHMMLMNRLPFILDQPGASTDDLGGLKFKNISLDAARTILVLVQQLRKDNTVISFYNWIMFFPLSAFLCICAYILSNPVEVPADDMKLIIFTSMNFFGSPKNWRDDQLDLTIFSQIDALLGVLVKVMLRAVVKYYEVKYEVSVVDKDPKLKKHLDSAEIEFPYIFKEQTEFKSKLDVVLLGLGSKRKMPDMFKKSSASKSKTDSGKSQNSTNEAASDDSGNSQTSPVSLQSIFQQAQDDSVLRPAFIEQFKHQPQMVITLMKQHQQQQRQRLQEQQQHEQQLQGQQMSEHMHMHEHLSRKDGKESGDTHPENQGQEGQYDSMSATPSFATQSNEPFHQQQKSETTSEFSESYHPNMDSTSDMFNDFVNEEDIASMFYSQMVNLPNLFNESLLG